MMLDGWDVYEQMKTDLEKRISERTHDIELAWEVSRRITEKTTDLYGLLKETIDLIRERFNLY